MTRPLTQADLIFPSQSLSVSSTLHSLKRSALSITNRLNSIKSDADFVSSVAEAYNLPLVANERCGSWYIPPESKAEGVYFKSTDGHMNEWSFSLRRLNLQLLDLVGRSQGCVIVDSTRRGKIMPDALSKTIPVWCCVMNRALFPESSAHDLHTPPQAVSASEHAQIEKRIDGFVRQFLDVCRPNIPQLLAKLSKPLRPIWITQASTLPESSPEFLDFHPVVLCTASRRVSGSEASEGGYIQGAADDHEAWSHGLTPSVFWNHKDRLLQTNEEDLTELIAQLAKEDHGLDAAPILINPTTQLHISTTKNVDVHPFDVVISCTPSPLTTTSPTLAKRIKYLHLSCQVGKLGSRDLRPQLPRLDALFSTLSPSPGKILVCCPSGRDLSVGVALTILCLYTDEKGVISSQRREGKIDKTSIKRRLAWLTTTSSTLNPPRGTLQSVNAFLMPDPIAVRSTASETVDPSTMKLAFRAAGTKVPHMSATALNPASNQGPDSRPLSSIPTTLFTALQNAGRPWTFTRTLSSVLPTHPSGTVTGTAKFTPYHPPHASTSTPQPPMLLYAEEGEFVTSMNMRFSTRRKYIYQLKNGDANEDPYIAMHFLEEEKGKEGGVGGLFVEMGELSDELSTQGDDEVLLKAKNREQHLCAEDLYTASWKFGRELVDGGERNKWWEVRYDVQGPKKDYFSDTRYSVD